MDQTIPRIKAFYGTSENAVKTQIWIAILRHSLSISYMPGSHVTRKLGLGHNIFSFQGFSPVSSPLEPILTFSSSFSIFPL